MDNKPKKSRAFIITFIIVLILLFVGYLLLRNTGTSNTKSSVFSKIFAPLLGTSQPKNVTPINNTANQNGSNTTDQNSNTGINANGNTPGEIDNSVNLNNSNLGNNTGISSSNLSPLPTPSSNGNNTGSGTLPTGTGTAALQPSTATNVAASLCPVDDPLSNYMSTQDKTDLDIYLKQFYLMAPTIRTENDITIVDNAILSNDSFAKGPDSQLDQLIGDCEVQKSAVGYTGPQEVKSNPFYPDPTIKVSDGGDGACTASEAASGQFPPGCKVVPESPTYLPYDYPSSATHATATTGFGTDIYSNLDPSRTSFNLFEKLLYIW